MVQRSKLSYTQHWRVQGCLEMTACGLPFPSGEAPSDQQRDFAWGLAILGLSSMRTVEGLRSKVTGFAFDDEVAPHFTLHCSGGKTPLKADMRPFDVVVPTEGFTLEFSRYSMVYTKGYVGRSYIFRAIERTRKRTAEGKASSIACGWAVPAACATPEMLSEMFYEIVALWGMDRARCKAMSLTPYGLRHLLADMTRAAGFSWVGVCATGFGKPVGFGKLVGVRPGPNVT